MRAGRDDDVVGDELPVIVISGDVLSGRSSELQALEANGVLSKPVELDELMAVVKRWAGSGRAARAAPPRPDRVP